MAAPAVTIVDGGGANIASLRFALERLGVKAELSQDRGRIRDSSHVILPGVGAAADAMRRLRKARLDELIPDLRQPVLGICLGMQLLASSSEENSSDCLNIVPGRSMLLPAATDFPVPNMGWCRLHREQAHPVLKGIAEGSFFYFVHSYALPVTDLCVASARHRQPFTAVFARDNFIATQFHPERSAAAGAQLLKNFLALEE